MLLGRKAMKNLNGILKSRDITFADKGLNSQNYGFPSSHVWMWELDYKESWATKNWCFWTVVLEKTLESPLDSKEIKPVNPKGNQSWIFIGRTDAEAETPILWPPDARKCIGKRPWSWERSKAREGIIDTMHMSLSKLWKMMMDREFWRDAIHGVTKSQAWLSNWTGIRSHS